MGIEKINELVIKAQYKQYRNIFINGIEYKFTVDMNVDDVIAHLEKYYDLTVFDRRNIKMLW